ncbi:MAG: polyprenyl synthetase family protein [Dehalococcoidia bacterium]
MELPSVFARYRIELEEYLRSALPEGSPALLYRMMRYHLGWEDEQGRPPAEGAGKALRPTLCLWACQALGGDWRTALPAAAALELVHNFSLVHDDIQDGDRERRHRPTVWSLWGQPQAINAGDSLLILGRLAMLRLEERGVAPAKVMEACRVLDKACLTMIEGQCLDIGFEDRQEVSVEAYLDMIARKTGALLGASLHLGALVATDDQRQAKRFARCGHLLGLAFQIRDDILGVWGAADVTGKPVAADIRRRKKSLPLVYAMGEAQAEEREQLLRVYSQEAPGDEEVSIVLQLLDSHRAYDYCQQMAQERIEQALAELALADIEPEARREFEAVAKFLLEREF